MCYEIYMKVRHLTRTNIMKQFYIYYMMNVIEKSVSLDQQCKICVYQSVYFCISIKLCVLQGITICHIKWFLHLKINKKMPRGGGGGVHVSTVGHPLLNASVILIHRFCYYSKSVSIKRII